MEATEKTTCDLLNCLPKPEPKLPFVALAPAPAPAPAAFYFYIYKKIMVAEVVFLTCYNFNRIRIKHAPSHVKKSKKVPNFQGIL
jgi:hypothetical protein